ncbi:MAG: redoxin family protein [Bacteroidetes bacterium]|nr:redoxin family protein [Bacteroidota bacterium]MBS1629708.1 redoxin family protein [Bacteroidota bacterium]
MNILNKALTILVAASLPAFAASAQDALPSTPVKDVSTGKKVAFNETISPGKVTLVSFWATWCVPCKKEIKNIRERLPQWHKEADFNYMTVSIDESRAEGLVRSYAKAQGWDFPYYIDPNKDLSRSLNFQNVPFTIIVDKSGKVAYMHAGYEEGGEIDVFAKVKELASK